MKYFLKLFCQLSVCLLLVIIEINWPIFLIIQCFPPFSMPNFPPNSSISSISRSKFRKDLFPTLSVQSSSLIRELGKYRLNFANGRNFWCTTNLSTFLVTKSSKFCPVFSFCCFGSVF